jgi:ATP-binding cassette subfamily F protein 3
MDTPVKSLSGGERARLLLGLITFSGPNLLILDEPTNHLDIDSRDALVAALNDYEGAVLIISHDRHLIEATVDKLWIAENGTISEFDEDLDSYQRMLTASGNPRNGGSGSGPLSKDDRKREKQEAAARRAELAPLRKSIAAAEHKLTRLRLELERAESRLADPAVAAGDKDRVIALSKDKARFLAEIEATEEAWLSASAELEAAQQAQG